MHTLLKEKGSLNTIRIHQSEMADVIYKDKGKEILYKGELYDVKTTSKNGDYIVFTCVNDKKETTLLVSLNNQTKYNSDSAPSSEKKQDTSSKNPVKDLFLHKNITSQDLSAAVVFPTATFHLTSYIPDTLPLPPPEVFIA